MTTRRYALRDDQWERIKDLLPGREGTVGVTAKDNRLFALSRAIPLPIWHSLARPTGAIWGFSNGAYAFESLVKDWGVGACVPTLGRRCRQ